MNHSLITFSIPFEDARAEAVETFLAGLGNPASAAVSDSLDATHLLHFMSVNVVRGDAKTDAHVVIELAADDSATEALARIEAAIGAQLRELLELAGVARDCAPLREFLARYQRNIGQGWFSAATGLDYEGTPEMSVWRIKREADLAQRASQILGPVPGSASALQKLACVRHELWQDDINKWAFIPEPAPFLAGNPLSSQCLSAAPRFAASAIAALLWPFVLIAAIAFVAAWYVNGAPTTDWVTQLVLAADVGVAVVACILLRRGATLPTLLGAALLIAGIGLGLAWCVDALRTVDTDTWLGLAACSAVVAAAYFLLRSNGKSLKWLGSILLKVVILFALAAVLTAFLCGLTWYVDAVFKGNWTYWLVGAAAGAVAFALFSAMKARACSLQPQIGKSGIRPGKCLLAVLLLVAIAIGFAWRFENLRVAGYVTAAVIVVESVVVAVAFFLQQRNGQLLIRLGLFLRKAASVFALIYVLAIPLAAFLGWIVSLVLKIGSFLAGAASAIVNNGIARGLTWCIDALWNGGWETWLVFAVAGYFLLRRGGKVATLFGVLLLIAVTLMLASQFENLWIAARVTAFVLVAELVVAVAAYLKLRRKEQSDIADDENPSAGIVEKIMQRENLTAQNHLFGVSTIKAGPLRRFTLRIGLWVVAAGAALCGRPSFLSDIGTIHFARWFVIPGTDKLLFLSNYDGSWESYLEDFITKAPGGLTAIWSNTAGYPKTSNLFLAGAEDGARFKRWARRQQQPTLFWYSAYPQLTMGRIRINAAIRQGIALAATEAEAADWLACFGSAPRPAATLDTAQIPTLVFSGLPKLPHARCIVLRLSGNTGECTAWVRAIADDISYGDSPPSPRAMQIAFSRTGLVKLGLTASAIATFSPVFQHGMAAPWRARALGDTGGNDPEKWWWGGPHCVVDAVMLIYAKDADELAHDSDNRITKAQSHGHTVVHQLLVTRLPKRVEQECKVVDKHCLAKTPPVREAFGFVDGISQPIVSGTRRATSAKDRNHIVEPGEFILGYTDNRGYLPPSPTVAAGEDPANVLPANVLPAAAPDQTRQRPNFATIQSSGQHDLGRNGTYLVVRQLEQDVDGFENFLTESANALAPSSVPRAAAPAYVREWIAAKLMGRWRDDGTSLVRHPYAPGSTASKPKRPDNDFQFGVEDPNALRCPFGAHIRRTNPRDSFEPGSVRQLAITNRHRILRVGRPYEPQNGQSKPGLLFMCLNGDIERQFEFIQQTWALAPNFHGLENEVDPILGPQGTADGITIPTADGPLRLPGLRNFVTVRGGGYFFLPGRKAIQFLSL